MYSRLPTSQIKTAKLSRTQKPPSWPFPVKSHTPGIPHHYSDFCYHRPILPVLECNINGISQYFLLCARLLCNIISVRGIHVVSRSSSSLKFLCNVSFYEGAPMYLSILLMLDICIVSSVQVFEQNNHGRHVLSSLKYL